MPVATVLLLVGLPGAGKTTLARRLEHERPALRLTPDEWLAPLVGGPGDGRLRDTLEDRLLWVGLRTAALGVDVVVDFGLWGRDERSALRALAAAVGARAQVRYLPVDPAAQWDRVRTRAARHPDTEFPMSRADLDRARTVFQPPTPDELDGSPPPAPPAGSDSWSAWAARRWPSLPDAYG